MTCLSEEALQEYVEHTLAPARRGRADEHLAECDACRATLAAVGMALVNTPSEVTPGERREGGWLLPGARVGRYVLGEELGSGGAGVVFAARDPELRRDVALKLARPRGRLSPGDRARLRERLRREAQAMARLRHPHVVAVFDVGVWQDRVFVAMELVAGPTLQGWLAARPRPWREVVARFRAAGEGLAAAHAAGLVHRDFKPANVLVGDDGRVCVTDFGLAASAGAGSPASSLTADEATGSPLTRTGGLVGTPRYMAPELFAGAAADARSDVFAFCVALFEGLYGEPPFSGGSALSLARAAAAGEIRQPAAAAAVPGWVRQIVLRGLRGRPEERYPSMRAILADLSHDPGRRLRRAALAAALAGVVAVVAARAGASSPCRGAERRLAAIWDDGVRAKVRAAFLGTGRAYAADTYARVTRTLDAYAGAWAGARTEVCEATARGEQSTALLDLRMGCLDRRLDDLAALGAVLSRAPDAEVLDRAAGAALGLEPLRGCAYGDALRNTPAPAIRARVAALRARLAAAGALVATGKAREARPRAEGIVAEARALAHAPLLAEALVLVAEIDRDLSDLEARKRALDELLPVAGKARDDARLAYALLERILILGTYERRPDEALAMRAAAAAAIARAGDPPGLRAELLATAGRIQSDRGAYADAEASYAEGVKILAEAPERDDLALAYLELSRGIAYSRDSKGEEALRSCRAAAELMGRALGPDHPHVALARNNTGAVLASLGRLAEARAELERAAAIEAHAFGADADLAATVQNLAMLDRRLGRLEQARQGLLRALALKERAWGPDDRRHLPDVLETLARTSLDLGRVGDAEAALARAWTLVERDGANARPEVVVAILIDRSEAHGRRGRLGPALADAERALAVADERLGAGHEDHRAALAARAAVLERMGRGGARRSHGLRRQPATGP